MNKKVILSSLTFLICPGTSLLAGGLWSSFAKQLQEAKEAEKKPLLGRLLTAAAHRDVRPLIIEYVATAPTFIDAVAQIIPLASTNKVLREESIKALANSVADQKDKSYATDLLFELIELETPFTSVAVPSIAIEALIRAGADVNAKNQDGWTPLMLAATFGRQEIVNILIRANADVNAKNQDGGTPLLWAVRRGHKEIVNAFINAGADVNAKDRYECASPLIWAFLCSHIRDSYKEIANALINAGADVNAKDREGNTPLLLAVANGHKGHKEIVSALINAGADVNAKYREGNGRSFEVGADLNKQYRDGDTPLQLAAQNGHIEIVVLLLQHGADPILQNHRGETAIDVAETQEIKDLLLAAQKRQAEQNNNNAQ